MQIRNKTLSLNNSSNYAEWFSIYKLQREKKQSPILNLYYLTLYLPRSDKQFSFLAATFLVHELREFRLYPDINLCEKLLFLSRVAGLRYGSPHRLPSAEYT